LSIQVKSRQKAKGRGYEAKRKIGRWGDGNEAFLKRHWLIELTV
jgi:hypothetical protein